MKNDKLLTQCDTYEMEAGDELLIQVLGISGTCVVNFWANTTGTASMRTTIDSEEWVEKKDEADILWEIPSIASAPAPTFSADIASLVLYSPNYFLLKNTGAVTVKFSIRINR